MKQQHRKAWSTAQKENKMEKTDTSSQSNENEIGFHFLPQTKPSLKNKTKKTLRQINEKSFKNCLSYNNPKQTISQTFYCYNKQNHLSLLVICNYHAIIENQ